MIILQVPGMKLTGRSSSVVGIRDIDPEDWAKGGFTMRKFNLQPMESVINFESSISGNCNFSAEEQLCYDLGLGEKWQGLKWKLSNWLKGAKETVNQDMVPRMTTGASKAFLTSLEQEFGSLPGTTTLDGYPIQIQTLKKDFAQLPNSRLRALQSQIQRELGRTQTETIRKSLERRLGDVATELLLRKNLF